MKNKISTSQFFLLATVLTFTFKLNSFSAVVYSNYKTGTLLVFCGYLLLDLFMVIMVYRLAKSNFFVSLPNKRRVVLSVSFSLFYVVKMIVYFSEQAIFVKNYLAFEMDYWLIYLVLFLTPLIFSRFQMNSLARVTEILLPVIALLLLVNLVFLQVDLRFYYNLPLINNYAKGYNNIFSYFAWSLDSLPLVVCNIKDRKDEKKRKKFIGYLSYFLGNVFSIMIVVFGISIYGGAFKMIDNLFVKISIFNDYNLMFGRLDWIGIMCFLTCSFIVLSANCIALKCTTQIMTKTKRNTSMIFLTVIYFLLVFYLTNFEKISQITVDFLGYICFYSLMIALLIVLFIQIWSKNGKKTFKK